MRDDRVRRLTKKIHAVLRDEFANEREVVSDEDADVAVSALISELAHLLWHDWGHVERSRAAAHYFGELQKHMDVMEEAGGSIQ